MFEEFRVLNILVLLVIWLSKNLFIWKGLAFYAGFWLDQGFLASRANLLPSFENCNAFLSMCTLTFEYFKVFGDVCTEPWEPSRCNVFGDAYTDLWVLQGIWRCVHWPLRTEHASWQGLHQTLSTARYLARCDGDARLDTKRRFPREQSVSPHCHVNLHSRRLPLHCVQLFWCTHRAYIWQRAVLVGALVSVD